MEKLEVTHLHWITPQDFKDTIISELQSELKHFLNNYKPEEAEEYLTRKEVSEILKVSIVTLIEWDKKGILNPLRLGNLIRYKRSDLEKSFIAKFK